MLRVCTSSTESALLSLDAYKAAAKITTTSDDAVIQSALDRATALVEGYIGYPLRRQVYSESVAAYGGLELGVSRTPIRSIESIYYSTELVDPTSYEIASEQGGLIYRELGWPWTAGTVHDLTAHPVPKSELRLFTVTYEAGYCVSGSTADGWLTTGEAVPADIEAALIGAATFAYKNASRDFSITSKKIGDLSVSYTAGGQGGGGQIAQSGGLPDTVKGLLAPWRRF